MALSPRQDGRTNHRRRSRHGWLERCGVSAEHGWTEPVSGPVGDSIPPVAQVSARWWRRRNGNRSVSFYAKSPVVRIPRQAVRVLRAHLYGHGHLETVIEHELRHHLRRRPSAAYL